VNDLRSIWKKTVVANLRYYDCISLERLKKRSQDNRSPARELNPGPLEYVAGVLTTPS
jgi:hypothetical protein